jgi:uncharacterized repeat protein (TIGR01451 family)
MRRVPRLLLLIVIGSVLLASFGTPPPGIAQAQVSGGAVDAASQSLSAPPAASVGPIRQVPPAGPTPPPHPPTDLDPATIRRTSASDRHPKLESQLVGIGRTSRTVSVSSALDQSRGASISVVGSQVRVIVEAAGGSNAGAKAAVQANGGTVEAEYANLVQALLPPANLEAVANDPRVAYVRTPAIGTRLAVAGQGVNASGANAWQSAGVTGTGVKVGVIDFGFTGYQQRQASGDLPASLTVVDYCNGQVNATGEEHGTAVAEIVYEMAPGVQLYLLCIGTDVQLGLAKDYAKANGIKILSSSITFDNRSRGDSSGPVGSPVAIIGDAFDNGILWSQAAGNEAQKHWSGNYVDVDGDDFHEFVPGDETQSIILFSGERICISLKWDSWPTSSQDFDLYFLRSSDLTLVTGSASDQNGSQTPTERLCYTNPGPMQYFEVIIAKYQATQAPRFDLFVDIGYALEYRVTAGSLVEMAATSKAFAVGAICWQNNQLEWYSSQGPTIDGRIKPDIAGQSVVSSASYGPFSSCANSGLDGFNGTSAAQPHVAGAAALVKQANPSFTPAQLQSSLEGRAIDQGPGGKDNQFGAGRLALGTAPASPASANLAVSLADSPDPVSNGQTVTFTVSVSNAGPQTATGVNVVVTLPAALTFQSSTCTGTKSGASCSGLSLTSGQNTSYQVVALANSVGTVTTTATVSSSVADPNSANNSASQQTTIASPVACAPRPPVVVSTAVVGGRLQVSLEATGTNNRVQSVRFGNDSRAPINALVDLPDGRNGLSGGLTVSLSQPAPSYTFWVRRATAGEPTTVPLVVTDGCGNWDTFVGGGTSAGF